MNRKLKQAIQNLHKAEQKYDKAIVRKYGQLKAAIDNELYIPIVGPAWKAYLAAGGSPTMIND